MKRFLALGLGLCLFLIIPGCGDTFRPIIIPNPPVFPNPAAAHTVVSINDNGTIVPGSAMVIDVSGDAAVSEVNVGLAPVYAVQQTANAALVVNHSVTGATADSLTKLSFSSTVISGSVTISLPPNSAPNFVAAAPSATTAYVTLPDYTPPSVGVVNTQSDNLVETIPVGNNPYALAVTPDNSKLYVANQADSTISGFNTSDRSQRVGSPVSTTSPPIWLTARSDSQAVYVLETSGTLGWLNTTSTAGPDTFTELPINVPGATLMVYDPNLNRLYIPGGQQLAIVDVSQSPPQYLTGGPITTCGLASPSASCIPTVSPSSRATTDPCSLTSPQTLTVVAVAALPNGIGAYVGAYYEDSNNNICAQVTTINTVSNTVVSSTAVPGFPDATIPRSSYYAPVCATTRFRFMMAAGGDSSRAYLSSCDGGMINIIDTSDNAYILNLPAPVGVRPPVPPNPDNQSQNPVFLFAGP